MSWDSEIDREREEKYIRWLVNESEDDALRVSRDRDSESEAESDSTFFENEKLRRIQGTVEEVSEYYSQPKDSAYDLTLEQKKELYAQITSVFNEDPELQTVGIFSSMRMGIAVLFGAAALATALPIIHWAVAPRASYDYSEGGRVTSLVYFESIPVVTKTFEDPELIDLTFDETSDPSDDVFEKIEVSAGGFEIHPLEIWEPHFEAPAFNFEESIIDLVDADVVPVPLEKYSPNYPTFASRQRLDGRVVVAFVVSETGEVLNAKVVRSSNEVFKKPSLDAIRRWHFQPGQKDGNVIQVRMKLEFVFNTKR